MINYKLKLFGHDNLFDLLVALEKNNKLPQKILLTGQEALVKLLLHSFYKLFII